MDAILQGAKTNALVGVGLRDQHYGEIVAGADALGFVEVHAENFFVAGGPALAVLQQVRERLDISLHATSLGLGAESLIRQEDLQQLKRLVAIADPLFISDHACFSWHRGEGTLLHSGDLLPIPFNDMALESLVANVERVQQALGRKIFIENISSYLTLSDNTMREFEFLQRLCSRSGAGLLLDLNNIYVNTVNAGVADPIAAAQEVVAGIDGDWVGEIHLAGSSQPLSGQPMIDDHGAEISDAVWQIYRYTLTRIGAKPTLVEWDTHLPALAVLIAQADQVKAIMEECCG